MARPLLLLALLGAVGGVVFATGLHQRVEPETVVELLRGTGAWGPVAFVALFSVLGAVGVPGIIFLVAAVTLWPEWAFLLNLAGSVGAGCVGFAFARYVARDWVAAHLPERLRRYDARLAERGLRTVISIRLIFFLFAPSHWMLGLSRASFLDMLLGTIVGCLPWVAFFTFVGVGLVEWLRGQPPRVWLSVLAVTVGVTLLWRAIVRRRAAAGEIV